MKGDYTWIVEVSLVATDDVSWIRHVDSRICGGGEITDVRALRVRLSSKLWT